MLSASDRLSAPRVVESIVKCSRWISSSEDERRDVIHEALIGVMKAAAFPDDLQDLLYFATRNRFIDMKRRKNARPVMVGSGPLCDVEVNDSPLEAAIRAEEIEQVAQSISRLREKDRDAIRSLDGNASYGAMKKRRQRAHENMMCELLSIRGAS